MEKSGLKQVNRHGTCAWGCATPPQTGKTNPPDPWGHRKDNIVKIRTLASTTLALTLSLTLLGSAYAEDAKPAAPAAPAAAPSAPAAAPAAPEAKPAAKPAKPKTEVKAEIAGKLATKKVKNKQGKEVDALIITVTSAKSADGKALDAMKGKTLRVAGKKELNLKSYVGKDVTVNGTVVNGRRLNVASIK